MSFHLKYDRPENIDSFLKLLEFFNGTRAKKNYNFPIWLYLRKVEKTIWSIMFPGGKIQPYMYLQ